MSPQRTAYRLVAKNSTLASHHDRILAVNPSYKFHRYPGTAHGPSLYLQNSHSRPLRLLHCQNFQLPLHDTNDRSNIRLIKISEGLWTAQLRRLRLPKETNLPGYGRAVTGMASPHKSNDL